ncbi:ubiquinol oxidase subunit II [Roseomonas sp. NAR14]|uniref:Ubiquinol oxidase polypeptide II n=1 Tax=Roseomonas acroporae TaxID=2937791 RepID=A0A9X1Y7C9_9PROT|nr:ubiquinol oxidase subunit II [Roseomonas acroporae]MCK8784866.1 ubiquinol oxidase subunit II [Roseomonas acroporae]
MPKPLPPGRFLRLGSLLALPALLGGCNLVVLRPAGDVAQQQGDLVVISTILMLIIIVPVMALTAFFAWRYRAANTQARYEPEWSHSTGLELVIWAAPLLIIICLGAITWAGTHLLDPFRPLARTAPGQPVAAGTQPLEVQVVALDWKWLFILPEQGIATVNELAAPVDRPIRFRISSSSVMNSFYIPALAGQIYAMPGMESRLHAVINRPGEFTGFSANYSGAGFSQMRFAFRGLDQAGFDRWVAEARSGNGGTLDRAAYLELERPSEAAPVRRFAAVEPGLFDAVVGMCVEAGTMCLHQMAAIDARGGLGLAGLANLRPVAAADPPSGGAGAGRQPGGARRAVAALCAIPEAPAAVAAAGPAAGATPARSRPASLAPLAGAGLPIPGRSHPAEFTALPPRPADQPES